MTFGNQPRAVFVQQPTLPRVRLVATSVGKRESAMRWRGYKNKDNEMALDSRSNMSGLNGERVAS